MFSVKTNTCKLTHLATDRDCIFQMPRFSFFAPALLKWLATDIADLHEMHTTACQCSSEIHCSWDTWCNDWLTKQLSSPSSSTLLAPGPSSEFFNITLALTLVVQSSQIKIFLLSLGVLPCGRFKTCSQKWELILRLLFHLFIWTPFL